MHIEGCELPGPPPFWVGLKGSQISSGSEIRNIPDKIERNQLAHLEEALLSVEIGNVQTQMTKIRSLSMLVCFEGITLGVQGNQQGKHSWIHFLGHPYFGTCPNQCKA